MLTAATRPHDSARYLDSEDAIEEYLAAAFEESDPKGVAHALGVIARARGMTQLSRDTGIAREALYREATRLAMQDTPLIPIHHQVNIFAIRKGLVFHMRMQEGIRAWDIEPGS